MKSPIPLPRFSLKTLFIAVLGVAIAITALKFANPIWASSLFTLLLVVLFAGFLGAVFGRAERRVFWAGLVLSGLGYLTAVYGPWFESHVSGHLATTHLLSYLHGQFQETVTVQTPPTRASKAARLPATGGMAGGGMAGGGMAGGGMGGGPMGGSGMGGSGMGGSGMGGSGMGGSGMGGMAGGGMGGMGGGGMGGMAGGGMGGMAGGGMAGGGIPPRSGRVARRPRGMAGDSMAGGGMAGGGMAGGGMAGGGMGGGGMAGGGMGGMAGGGMGGGMGGMMPPRPIIMTVGPSRADIMRVGHSVFGFLLALIGGALARWMWLKGRQPGDSQPLRAAATST